MSNNDNLGQGCLLAIVGMAITVPVRLAAVCWAWGVVAVPLGAPEIGWLQAWTITLLISIAGFGSATSSGDKDQEPDLRWRIVRATLGGIVEVGLLSALLWLATS